MYIYISQFARGTNLKLESHVGEAFRQTRCPRRRLASQVNNIYCMHTYIYIYFTETERDREREDRDRTSEIAVICGSAEVRTERGGGATIERSR